MEAIEYDVFVSYCADSGLDLARRVAAGLAARGFRVFLPERRADAAASVDLLDIVEQTPDFLLVLTPGVLDGGLEDNGAVRREAARALETDRNVVYLSVPGCDPRERQVPADLAWLDRRPGIRYGHRAGDESISRVAHLLSSDASVDDRREMTQAKRIGGAVGLLLLGLVAILAARALPRMFARPVEPAPVPPIALYWSSFVERAGGAEWNEVPAVTGKALQSGDRVKVVFSPSADGFAYVVAKDARGDVTVLFPSPGSGVDSRVRAGQLYEAPVQEGWLTLGGEPDIDSVYVLASYDPIDNLESLVEERHEEAGQDARQALVQSTIDGLLDGRHAVGDKARTRRGRAIIQSLDVPRPVSTASVRLSDGKTVTHRLDAQPGLLSVVAELKLRRLGDGRQ